MQRESAWRITWDPTGASPRVLLDFGDLMDDEIGRTLVQVVDVGRFDQAANGKPYGRGNRKRRMELQRLLEFATAPEAWQAMFAAMAGDPWAAKALLRIETMGGGSTFCRAALLGVARKPVTLPFPGFTERLSLRVNGGLTGSGSPLTVTGGWYNPPVVGGGTASGGITVIIGGTSTGLAPGDVVKVTGVKGVTDGSYTVTGVTTSGGNTQVKIDTATTNRSRDEQSDISGSSTDGFVELSYPGSVIKIDGMTDGATYTWRIKDTTTSGSVSPGTFGRATISLGALASRITYSGWIGYHPSLDPLPIDGQNHSQTEGTSTVVETGPTGWEFQLLRNGTVCDSHPVKPSWSTRKAWVGGGPANHGITAAGGVTATLHGPGTSGSERGDTGIAEQTGSGGTVQKQT